MIKVNDFVNNRYKVTGVLGHGGMSEVFSAEDIIFKRIVAIKIIKEAFVSRPESIIRFENEARFSSALNHPNIVKIYDFNKYDDLPYIVNEYVKGKTLKDYIDAKKRFSIQEVCHIMLQLCDAMMYVHNKGIIHRDIKPQNIFYDSNGDVKLADFGISYLLNSNLNVYENKRVMGTAEYLAPEVIRGKTPSFQSDVFAMGVTFYELITGCVPFDGDNPSEIAKMQVNNVIPSPKKIIPNLSDDICEVIFKATNKDLNIRYKNAGEMRTAIHDLVNKPSSKENKGFFNKLFGR